MLGMFVIHPCLFATDVSPEADTVEYQDEEVSEQHSHVIRNFGIACGVMFFKESIGSRMKDMGRRTFIPIFWLQGKVMMQ